MRSSTYIPRPPQISASRAGLIRCNGCEEMDMCVSVAIGNMERYIRLCSRCSSELRRQLKETKPGKI